MSDVRINTRSPYYVEANPTPPETPETPVVDPPTNIAPTVTITATNTTPYVGDTVTLTAVASDSDGTIVSYLWGGTPSPETTTSIDVVSTTVQSKVYNVIVTDDDGDVGLAQIVINWQEVPQQITNTGRDVNCGEVVNEASFLGTKTYNLVGVGDKIGDVEIEFLDNGNNRNVPILFDISWNNTTVTTGYIGLSNFSGTIPSNDNTGDPTTKSEPTTLTISKTAASPTEVVLTASTITSEGNDSYSFRLNCPDVEATQTFFYTLRGTCTNGDTTFNYLDVNGVEQTEVLSNGQTRLISAQEDTVSLAICTGDTEKGSESFDLGTPDQEFNDNIEINIVFDDSGSMDTTLQPLLDMADGILKSRLLSFYGGDTVKYNEQVKVLKASEFNNLYTQVAGFPSPTRERFLNFASYGKTNPQSTKNIYLFFTDEVTGSYKNLGVQSPIYDSDLALYRSYLDSVEYGEHFMRTFIIYRNVEGDNEFIQAIFNGGTHNNEDFSGYNGLSDRAEASKEEEILQGGVSYSTNPNYYYDFIIRALQDYGFNI